MKIQHNEDYRKLRAAEYPAIGDQLDAIYKLAEAVKGVVEFHPDTMKWMDQIAAVKAKYSK